MDQRGVADYRQEDVEEVPIAEMAWRLDVKAVTEHSVFGGVLADDVGYGKTATTFALINVTRWLNTPLKDVKGSIPVKAKLILVTSKLVGQRVDEKEDKFCCGENKVIRISTWHSGGRPV